MNTRSATSLTCHLLEAKQFGPPGNRVLMKRDNTHDLITCLHLALRMLEVPDWLGTFFFFSLQEIKLHIDKKICGMLGIGFTLYRQKK